MGVSTELVGHMHAPMSRARQRAGLLVVASALGLALTSTTGVVAQSETSAGDVIEVTAAEYAFLGLPTSVPVGTSLGLRNDGAEVHEMILIRIADGVTETLDELLAMDAEGRDPMEEGLVEMIGEAPLFASPGETAEGTVPLESEGRYVVICFVPQGLTDPSLMEQMMTASGPEDMPEEAAALMEAPPHFALGMVQEFTVTGPDSTPGPLPEPAEADAIADESPSADA